MAAAALLSKLALLASFSCFNWPLLFDLLMLDGDGGEFDELRDEDDDDDDEDDDDEEVEDDEYESGEDEEIELAGF